MFALLALLLHVITLFATAAALSTFTSRSPVSRIVNNGISTDPEPVTPIRITDALPLICPYGIQRGGTAKNILFVHGTGSSGDTTWKGGMPDAFFAKG